jgi:hypothetical protein
MKRHQLLSTNNTSKDPRNVCLCRNLDSSIYQENGEEDEDSFTKNVKKKKKTLPPLIPVTYRNNPNAMTKQSRTLRNAALPCIAFEQYQKHLGHL